MKSAEDAGDKRGCLTVLPEEQMLLAGREEKEKKRGRVCIQNGITLPEPRLILKRQGGRAGRKTVVVDGT